MYQSYITVDDYAAFGAGIIPDTKLERQLRTASRHIDALTYNRIVGQGFSMLTEFQQEVIREVICLQADFEYENSDEISTILSGYSINGVSAQFGESWNVFMDAGVAMKRDVYELLKQTGLCCRTLGRRQ